VTPSYPKAPRGYPRVCGRTLNTDTRSHRIGYPQPWTAHTAMHPDPSTARSTTMINYRLIDMLVLILTVAERINGKGHFFSLNSLSLSLPIPAAAGAPPPPPQRRHSQDRPIHRPDDQASIQEVLHEALSNMDWIGGVSPLIVVMTNLAMAERGSLAMQVITEPPIHHSAR
jgi:hypothetical protein